MHDLFEILGLPTNARARDVRRACARPRRLHPDFQDAAGSSLDRPIASAGRSAEIDVAIDFVDASVFADEIQAQFFREPRP